MVGAMGVAAVADGGEMMGPETVVRERLDSVVIAAAAAETRRRRRDAAAHPGFAAAVDSRL